MALQLGWPRLLKLGGAWLIIFAVYMIASKKQELQANITGGHWVPEWTDKSRKTQSVQIKLDDQAPLIEDAKSFWDDGHKAKTADDFRSHFEKVLRLKHITKEEANATCTWNKDDRPEPNFMFHNEVEWIVDPRTEEELAEKRSEWHAFIRDQMLAWEDYKNHFWGRGIVVVAGNDSGLSVKRLLVMLRQLRALKSQMPVEIHYWDYEMSSEIRRNITQTYPLTFFNDLSDPATNIFRTTDHTPYINYQYKSVALVNSRFAEVLLLDADNIPAIDPNELFESDTYKEYGTIFWPDIARTRPQNPAWTIFDTPCKMDEYEMESGQLLIDKRRYWYHMQLAAWLNNEHSWYFKLFLLGDKDMFRFTWHALKTRYGRPKRWLTSVGYMHENSYCGHTFAQHHPDGRIAFLHGGTLKTIDAVALKHLRNEPNGIWQAYQRSEHDDDPSYLEDVWIKWEGYDWLPNKPEKPHIGHCTEMKNVKAKPLSEVLPPFNEQYDKDGGYFFADDDHQYYYNG